MAGQSQRRPRSSAKRLAASPMQRIPLAACLGAILAATFLVYLPSLDNGFTNWDDDMYVIENSHVRHPDFRATLTEPMLGNYHPLTIWSLALNYRLAGLNPAPYHLFNLLLHLANTALVFVFVRRLSPGRFWTAAVTSLFFGIHPMHVESVAWIAERKDVLYAFFLLLGLIAYVFHVERPGRLRLMAALAAFVLSAASKPAAVVFPLLLLAVDLFRGRAITGSVLLEKIPFFVVSLGVGLLTLQAQETVGAITNVWSPFQKVLFGAYGLTMYVAKFFLPVGLSAIYPYPSPSAGPGAPFYVAFAIALVVVPAVLLLARRSRPILFGLTFYFLNIALVLQVFTLGGAVMADRYTYVSYIGLLFALSWWLDERESPRALGLPIKPAIAGMFLLLLPLSLSQTWKRCDVWQNSETLWNDTITKHPRQIADAYVNRGTYYYREAGRPRDALADFDEALVLDSQRVEAWLHRGNALVALGQDDSAVVSYDRAVLLQPTSALAVNNRGAARLRMGQFDRALPDFTRAIELDPRLRDAFANRASAYVSLGEYERSIADSRRAMALDPGNATNYLQSGSIAFCEQKLGRHREAVADFDQAIQAAPEGEPRRGAYHLYRSVSLRALGDRARALADAREARRLGETVPDEYLRDLSGN